MTTLDHGRRLAVLLIVVLNLLLVPSMALAQFSSTRSAALLVSTDRMATPAAVTGTFVCNGPNAKSRPESINIAIADFTDSGPAGATYAYVLAVRGTPIRSTITSNHAMAWGVVEVPNDKEATDWTVTIQSRLGAWSGTPYTRTITCPAGGSPSGDF